MFTGAVSSMCMLTGAVSSVCMLTCAVSSVCMSTGAISSVCVLIGAVRSVCRQVPSVVCVCQQVPSAVQTKDPFNISNDEHYNPKVMDNALRPNIGSSLIQVCIVELWTVCAFLSKTAQVVEVM